MPAPALALRSWEANILCRRDTTRPEIASTTMSTNGIQIFFSARPTGIDFTRAPSADPPFVVSTVPASAACARTALGRTIGIRDEPTQDRICHPRRKPQRAFLLRRQRRQQRREAFPADPLAVVEERLTLLGDADEGSAPIVGVGKPGHQTLALEPLDQLGHRRLADALLGASVVSRMGPSRQTLFIANAAEALKVGAVGQKAHRQVDCLVEQLANAVAGALIGRLFRHVVSISRALCSGNR